MILYDIEGELFFGAAPELDRSFDSLAPSIKTATVPGSQVHRELIPSLESVLSRKSIRNFLLIGQHDFINRLVDVLVMPETRLDYFRFRTPSGWSLFSNDPFARSRTSAAAAFWKPMRNSLGSPLEVSVIAVRSKTPKKVRRAIGLRRFIGRHLFRLAI